MTLKTLLLGSAAAFAVVGGAQAADLSVAEPVESVKVCDTFGSGYWYIPGSDTCLKIGGNVEFDINIHDLTSTYSSHSSNYDFVTKMGLTFDASSMTDVGRLDGHIALKGTYNGQYGVDDGDDSSGQNSAVYLDGAYLAIGALKAGHFGSTFNPDASFVDANEYKSTLADANKLQLSWAAAGFGLALGIEDPRETWGSYLPDTWSMPLITGKITASQGSVSGLLSAGFAQLYNGTVWGVDGEVTFGVGANDKIRLNAAYGDGAFTGQGRNTDMSNDSWSAFASFQHMFSTALAFDADFSYLQPESSAPSTWAAAADLVWTPYTGFSAKVRAGYVAPTGSSGTWSALVALKRAW